MNEITQFLISHGGLFLFAIAFAEQSGLPFPGAPWLLAAGALAASGKFSLTAAIGWTAIGCVAADALWFYLGQRGRVRVFRLFPHLYGVRTRLQQSTLTGTILHGTRMLTAAKFLPFGTVIPLQAGAMEVGSLRFLIVDAFTSIVYATFFVFIGFAFHNQLEQVAAILARLGVVSLLLIAVLAGWYVVYRVRKHRSKIEPAANLANKQN